MRIPGALAVVLLTAASGLRAASGPSVTAAVDPSEVTAGEMFRYQIQVQGATMSGVEPAALQLPPGLELASGPNTESSFSWINGTISSSKIYSWVLLARKEGSYRIPALDVKIGDKLYRTDPVDVSVVKGAAPAPTVRGGGPAAGPSTGGRGDPGLSELRLENETSATKVYVGQPIVLTTRLLTRVPVADWSQGPDPTVAGFLLEEVENNGALERVFREGREYRSKILMRRVLTPTTPGRTLLPAEKRRVIIQVEGRTAFESFFSPRTLEVERSTAPIAIEVLAPPVAGRPADFSGAVGSFRLEASADRTEAAVGDAVGLQIKVTGSGSLKTVDAPALAPSADFRAFDPRVEEKASGTSPRIYTKTWSYVLTPLAPGKTALPSISFSYFDPEAGVYKKASSQVLPLMVRKAESAGPLTVASAKREVQALRRDIRFLKPLDRPLRRRTDETGSWTWILGIVALSIALQPAAWWVGRRGGPGALLPGRRRARARRRALGAIARASAGDATAPRASAAIASALLDYLGERLGIPAIGLTYDEIEQELARRGTGGDVRAELRAILELCDLGRFAPEAERRPAPPELLARARALVERLDSQIGRAA